MVKKETVFWVPPVFADDGEQLTSGIGSDGKEYPDPVPVAVPLDEQRQTFDMMDSIRRLMANEYLRQKAEEEGFDTPEEADDFEDWEDDFEISPYQRQLMEKDLNPDPALASQSGQGQVKEAPSVGAAPPEASKSVVSRDRGKSDSKVESSVDSVREEKSVE